MDIVHKFAPVAMIFTTYTLINGIIQIQRDAPNAKVLFMA